MNIPTKFILWQNILSIHQNAFVKALADISDVTLVVEHTLDSDCLHEQSQVPDMGNAKIITAPCSELIEQLIHTPDVIHFVAGLDFAFKSCHLVQRLLKANAKILCYCEPYIWNDGKGWLRSLKYRWIYWLFARKIPGILTMGDTGRQCMLRAGYRTEQLFDWGYFTETPQETDIENAECNGLVRFIFAGRLDENKNCLLLLQTMHAMKEDFRLTIVGDGRCRKQMETIWEADSRMTWKGLLPNKETQRLIGQHDVLILPSKYDGWGAVVNEALMHGTRVVCSENCGAGALLADNGRGEIFSFTGHPSLLDCIQHQLSIGGQVAEKRQKLILWSKKCLSGTAVAEYFSKVVALLTASEVTGLPKAPWK